MQANQPTAGHVALHDPGDFSFILGGLLFQLLRRLHLSGNALELTTRRILVTTAIAWVPLFILSIIQGLATGSAVVVPFLHDIEAHARLLVVVPLLIGAEPVVHQRLRAVARQFIDRGLIPESEQPRFDAVLASTVRLRDSLPIEMVLLALVYLVGVQIVWRHLTALDVPTWYAVPHPETGSLELSLAGWWYAYFSLPIMQFLFLRWYFRLFLWTRFLWLVSRINLHLVPTHPDLTGGLGFLALTPYAFVTLAFAHGALLSGWIAGRVLLHEAVLLDFKYHIIAFVAFVVLIFLGPLFIFSLRLAELWRQGEQEYGPLALRYAQEFEAKWVRTGARAREPLLGSRDTQGLADMANVYRVVQSTKLVPITKLSVIQLLLWTVVPLAPLALTVIPLGNLAKLLMKAVF